MPIPKKLYKRIKKLYILVEKVRSAFPSLYQWIISMITNVLCKPCTTIAMSCKGKDWVQQQLLGEARSETTVYKDNNRSLAARWLTKLGDLEKIVLYYATYLAFGLSFRVEDVCSFVIYALNKIGISLELVFNNYRQLYKRIHAACQRLAYPCREKKKDGCSMPRLLIHNPNTKTYSLNPEYHDVGQYIEIIDVLNSIVKRWLHRNIHSTPSNSDPGKDRELPEACCNGVVLCDYCPQEFYDGVFKGEKALIRIVHSNAKNLVQLIKLVALLRKLLDAVFEALVTCAIIRGILSKDHVEEIVKKVEELAERVRRMGKMCFGYHKGVKGKNKEKFSPLMPYTKAIALYSMENAEPGTDIFIPNDVGKEIEGFLGFRFFEKSYLVTAEHLTETGAMKRWRERMKNLLDYIKNRSQ